MPSSPVVDIKDLVKRYGELVAVDHLSLQIRQGEVFGLLGPNGSGKTTTIGCLLQLLRHDHGTIELFGQPMTPTSYALKRRVGIVPQEIAVFNELTVRENVESFCALYVTDARERRQLVSEAIAFVNLEPFERFRPRKLSGGLLRRLNIACGIAHKPDLVIFDEPTVSVDPQSRNAILEGIARLNAEGATVIYTSLYMEEVERLCSRILIMDHGRAVATGTADELKAMVGLGEKITVEVPGATEGLLEELRALPHVRSVHAEGATLHVACATGAHNLVDVLSVLDRDGLAYGQVLAGMPDLNDVFLEITGSGLRDNV